MFSDLCPIPWWLLICTVPRVIVCVMNKIIYRPVSRSLISSKINFRSFVFGTTSILIISLSWPMIACRKSKNEKEEGKEKKRIYMRSCIVLRILRIVPVPSNLILKMSLLPAVKTKPSLKIVPSLVPFFVFIHGNICPVICGVDDLDSF